VESIVRNLKIVYHSNQNQKNIQDLLIDTKMKIISIIAFILKMVSYSSEMEKKKDV
jgi:hypothetical protein